MTGKVLTDRRQAFRLALEERIRDLADPDAVMTTAVTMLGEHLGADRVGYGRVLPDDVTVRLSNCYVNGIEPVLGEHPLDAFGPESIARQRRGETSACTDVASDPDQDEAVWAAIDTRAYVSVPLIRDGRLRASLYVNSREPRRWSADEIALIEEVAARTWASVERAGAEQRLEAERERQRLMLQQMPGFAALLSGPEHRFDYVNDAYVEMAGRRDFIGRTVREVFPELEGQEFFALLDRAYESGEPFTARAMPISFAHGDVRVLDFLYEPVRDDAGRVTGIFAGGYDVTEGVRAGRELRASEERYRTLFEAIDVGFCIVEMKFDAGMRPIDYRLAEINPAFERQTGLSDARGC